MTKTDTAQLEKLSPSEFMRELRPEYYSDTEDRVAYILERAVFEYHLDSITSRSENQDFEIFCRKLCERTICPHLRPHTGPDGGGDSKADTETYPVSEKISKLFYVGQPNSGNERWAFAFSAKKTWFSKVRIDVKGIVETGRNYKRIFFVTSRFSRDKDRARIEDELTNKYCIPVTILDRSWIVKEILENDRKDIAYNYLGIGEAKNDPHRLGPMDYSRAQQLADIERSIDDPEAFLGMEQDRVTEALVAAKLSRNLEHNRTEIDGRFLRAIRLADTDGTYRQQLKSKYEHIWTTFWWFDDFKHLKDSYESFETIALESDYTNDLELLCNLQQLLVNSVIHGHMTRDESRLEERITRLRLALEKQAKDKSRPNNSLGAQILLLVIRMNQTRLDNTNEELSDIWNDFAVVLEKATGLGEFDADRVVSLIEIAANVAGNDPAYNNLIEKLAEFVGTRKSEAEGALILLKRAQSLDFSDSFEMIRLLGKAVLLLSKKEYRDYLIEALHLLTLAYRSAGMLWAARASCVFLAASLSIEGEENDELPISIVPTMKAWAWIAFELCHIPDFLYAVQLLNGALAALPLTEETKANVREDIHKLDFALGSLFLNLDEPDFHKLGNLPDILEALGLFTARSALLYILGYMETLRTDGSLPATESDEEVKHLFSMLASQPATQNLRRPIILNTEGSLILGTSILGMTVTINIEGSLQSILVAEAVLGTLEAFFVTVIEQRVIPHTEKIDINLIESDDVSLPSFEMNPLNMTGILIWPTSLSLTSFDQQEEILQFLAALSGRVLSATCMIQDVETLIEKLYRDGAVQQRMTMIVHTSNSYHRFAGKKTSRLNDWQEVVKKSYTLRTTRPTLTVIKQDNEDIVESTSSESTSEKLPKVNDHRKMSVQSVIDIHTWDKATWRGIAFTQFGPEQPPCLALLFENRESARKIFERWHERFGNEDKNEEIAISIVGQLPQKNKHHYCALITSRQKDTHSYKTEKAQYFAIRFTTMEPDNSTNLENFLSLYKQFGAFYLMPAVLNDTQIPELIPELSILKREITYKVASNIGKHEIESIVLRRS